MNLRDKLRAVEGGPRPKAPPKPVNADCFHCCETRDAAEFPGAMAVRRETVALMQGEALPEQFDPRRILYLDTETTGFAGAGTVAFLVGLGWWGPDGFEVHQYLMRDYPEERYVLEKTAEACERFDVLCTFNGRSFDVPLLRDRFLLNRLPAACLEKPHIDLLHIARRIWRLRLKRCNLSALEEAVLDQYREDDLPGAQVPQRFFDYLKTGQFDLLRDVLRHNAQDIASLCVLLSRMAAMYERPEDVEFSEDVYSMGVALERFHHPEEARRCYELAAEGSMRAQGRLRLAQCCRRAGERDEAVAIWQTMIRRHEGGATPFIELAKHFEHIERDIPAALEMTRRAMAILAEETLIEDRAVQEARNAVQYRYDRLKAKQVKKEL